MAILRYKREISHRVFASEFNNSDIQEKEGDDQYSRTYVITPTGAKCNRVFIVGTLTEKDNIGTETEFWRGRITDPTGAFKIYAGQYQLDVSQSLSKIEPPEFVSVVGKPNVYTTEEETNIVSIRPESIQVVDKATYCLWVVDTAKHTLKRLNKLNEQEKIKEHYNTDIEEYKEMVKNALKSIIE